MSSVEPLRSILKDPETRVLMILDSSGSVAGSSLYEEAFAYLNLAREGLDPSARRSMVITDSFCQHGPLREPAPLPAGAMSSDDIPPSQLRGAGGGEHALVAIAATALFQHYAPTHLVYAGDLQDMCPSPDKLALPPERNLFLLWDATEASVQMMRSYYAAAGKVGRLFYAGEAQALMLDRATPSPSSMRVRPRM